MSFQTRHEFGADVEPAPAPNPRAPRANWGKEEDPTSAVAQLKALVAELPTRPALWTAVLPAGQPLWNGLSRSQIEDKMASPPFMKWRATLPPSNPFFYAPKPPKAPAAIEAIASDEKPSSGLDALAELAGAESVVTIPVDDQDTKDDVQSARAYFKWKDNEAATRALFEAVEKSSRGLLRRVDWKMVVQLLHDNPALNFPADYNTTTLATKFKELAKNHSAPRPMAWARAEENELFDAVKNTPDDWDAVLAAMSTLSWPEGLDDEAKKRILQEKFSSIFKAALKSPKQVEEAAAPPATPEPVEVEEAAGDAVEAAPAAAAAAGNRLKWTPPMVAALTHAKELHKSNLDKVVQELDVAFKDIPAWTALDAKTKKKRLTDKLTIRTKPTVALAPAAGAAADPALPVVQGHDFKHGHYAGQEEDIIGVNQIIIQLRSNGGFMEFLRTKNQGFHTKLKSLQLLNEDSTFDAVKTVYKVLALIVHPDKSSAVDYAKAHAAGAIDDEDYEAISPDIFVTLGKFKSKFEDNPPPAQFGAKKKTDEEKAIDVIAKSILSAMPFPKGSEEDISVRGAIATLKESKAPIGEYESLLQRIVALNPDAAPEESQTLEEALSEEEATADEIVEKLEYNEDLDKWENDILAAIFESIKGLSAGDLSEHDLYIEREVAIQVAALTEATNQGMEFTLDVEKDPAGLIGQTLWLYIPSDETGAEDAISEDDLYTNWWPGEVIAYVKPDEHSKHGRHVWRLYQNEKTINEYDWVQFLKLHEKECDQFWVFGTHNIGVGAGDAAVDFQLKPMEWFKKETGVSVAKHPVINDRKQDQTFMKKFSKSPFNTCWDDADWYYQSLWLDEFLHEIIAGTDALHLDEEEDEAASKSPVYASRFFVYQSTKDQRELLNERKGGIVPHAKVTRQAFQSVIHIIEEVRAPLFKSIKDLYVNGAFQSWLDKQPLEKRKIFRLFYMHSLEDVQPADRKAYEVALGVDTTMFGGPPRKKKARQIDEDEEDIAEDEEEEEEEEYGDEEDDSIVAPAKRRRGRTTYVPGADSDDEEDDDDDDDYDEDADDVKDAKEEEEEAEVADEEYDTQVIDGSVLQTRLRKELERQARLDARANARAMREGVDAEESAYLESARVARQRRTGVTAENHFTANDYTDEGLKARARVIHERVLRLGAAAPQLLIEYDTKVARPMLHLPAPDPKKGEAIAASDVTPEQVKKQLELALANGGGALAVTFLPRESIVIKTAGILHEKEELRNIELCGPDHRRNWNDEFVTKDWSCFLRHLVEAHINRVTGKKETLLQHFKAVSQFSTNAKDKTAALDAFGALSTCIKEVMYVIRVLEILQKNRVITSFRSVVSTQEDVSFEWNYFKVRRSFRDEIIPVQLNYELVSSEHYDEEVFFPEDDGEDFKARPIVFQDAAGGRSTKTIRQAIREFRIPFFDVREWISGFVDVFTAEHAKARDAIFDNWANTQKEIYEGKTVEELFASLDIPFEFEEDLDEPPVPAHEPAPAALALTYGSDAALGGVFGIV